MAEIQQLRADILELDREIRRLRAEQQQRGAGDFVRANAITGVVPSANVPAHGSIGLWTNQSGGALGIGAVVIQNGDRQFDTTTTADDLDVVGVLTEAVANTEEGRLRHQGYHPSVIVEGAVVAGQFLRTSTTAGAAEDAGTIPTEGVFGMALTAAAGPGAGTVAAYLFGTIGALTAASVYLPRVSGSTYDDVEDANTLFGSAGWFSGGAVSDAGGGNVDVTAGTGVLRSAATVTAQLLFIDWPLSAGHAIPVGTTRYIGVEWNMGVPQVTVRATENFDNFTDFELAIVVRQPAADGGEIHIDQHEQHAGDVSHRVIERWHQTNHIERDNELGGNILGESNDNNRNVEITAGAYWVGLDRTALGLFDSSGAATFDTYSAGGLEAAGVSVWPNLQYDNGGVLANLGGNKWANLWWYQELDGDVVMLYGTAQYNTEAMAGEEAVPTTVPDIVTVHGTLIGRYVFQRGDTIPAQVATAFVQMFAVAGVTVHSGLSGIGGGEDDHPEYLLADGSRNLTGDLLATVATEVQFRDTDLAIWSSADGQLDLKADTKIVLTAPIVELPSGILMLGVTDNTVGGILLHGDAGNIGGTIGYEIGAGQDAAFDSWVVGIKQMSDDLEFRVDSDVRMLLTAEGQLQSTVQGVAGGILIGGDAHLYRSAANVLYTPDSLTVVGTLLVDVINEETATVGVTAENVTIKDGSIELHHGIDTISSDEITTPTGGYIIAAAQAGVTDDLDGIGGGGDGGIKKGRAGAGGAYQVKHQKGGRGGGGEVLL